MPVRALQTDFFGDPNLGLFARASDKLFLVGRQLQDKAVRGAAKVLGLEPVTASIADSELVGMFSAMNSNGIILPKITSDSELEATRKLAKVEGMNVLTLGSDFTAIGNLILCNDRGAVLSSLLTKKDARKVEDCLGVECAFQTVAGLYSVGSCGIATNSGCLLHRDATEEELDSIQDILRVETDVGTANFEVLKLI